MAERAEKIGRELIDKAIDGILLYGADKLTQFVNVQLHGTTVKTLKQYSDGVLKLGIGFAIGMIPQLQVSEYVLRFGDLAMKKGMADIITQFIDKPAYVWADDASTIRVVNLDTTTPEVFIDGVKKATTDYTVSGSAEDLTIKLTTALSAGEHDVMVVGLKKAAVNKIKV